MATYGQQLRQGLPRVAGGDAWPPAGTSPLAGSVVSADIAPSVSDTTVAPQGVPAEDVAVAVAAPAAASGAATPAPADATTNTAAGSAAVSAAATPATAAPSAVRRGLPRVAGGEPWPAATVAAPAAPVATAPVADAGVADAAVTEPVPAAASVTDAAPAAAAVAAPVAAVAATGDVALRRGLPRTPGGEAWPAAGHAPQPAGAVADVAAAVIADEVVQPVAEVPAAAAAVAKPTVDLSQPLEWRRTVTPGKYAFVPAVVVEPKRIGKFTRGQWLGIAVVVGGALLSLAYLAVFFVQWLISLQPVADFLVTYPGEYDLPASAEPGFPWWAQWQHYFNIFLMVLIIRSGLRVRTERRPDAFWTPAWSKNGRGKISLTLWFHQALDLLWVLNGIIFITLLFVSGHWMRVVPTSWDVFPNALSAILQYISLDWPTEHGWVNYNSIQQLMYFTVIFIAAPLAVASGVRMSGLWPKNAKTLNKIYPVEVARAVHFPVMLFFVLFIIVHVFLVFATGALRNLNHMFGGTDVENWAGFWIFFAGMVVVVGAWIAARPLVLAPIAKVFGKVSMR